MTESIASARIDQLARILGVWSDDLPDLRRLAPEQIAALTRRLSDDLFDALAPTFDRISALAPLMPDALVASVAHKAIPADVAGRAAGALGTTLPDRIAGILSRMQPSYLAEAAPYVDPRVVSIVGPRVPAAVLVPAAQELLRRGEFGVAATFLACLGDDLVRALEQAITDDRALLRTVAMIDSGERLRSVVALVPETRRNRIVADAAQGDAATVAAALSVLSRLDGDFAGPLGAVLFERGEGATVDRIVTAAVATDAMRDLLILSDSMDDGIINRLAQHEVFLRHSMARDSRPAAG
ncbi:hypothetical protein [Nocardia sp. XZ_19_385]|uniref:hypothetical protein n=1 Tax=Nocardia sp. XZ_19_385 TaxID=2769488 RepID=UPI00188FD181|nr:hypothetical protein [Nocardia sp. XZ_19_385]